VGTYSHAEEGLYLGYGHCFENFRPTQVKINNTHKPRLTRILNIGVPAKSTKNTPSFLFFTQSTELIKTRKT